MQKQIPKFYGFRIYFSSNLLYFFLVIPFLLIMLAQNFSKISKKNGDLIGGAVSLADSIAQSLDTIPELGRMDADSVGTLAIRLGDNFVDTITLKKSNSVVSAKIEDDDGEHQLLDADNLVNKFFKLLFLWTLASFAIGLIYNIPFKRFFKRKRRKREIPERLHAYCKKYLLSAPLINALIVIFPSVVVISYFFFTVMLKDKMEGSLEDETFREFFYLTLLAALLEFLFVFYWQKHRLHLRYIAHVYTPEELRTNVFRRKGIKIRHKLLIASGLTTFLPLLIVMVYLLQSMTRVRDLGVENLPEEAFEILYGPLGGVLGPDNDSFILKIAEKLVYVNAFDSFFMFIGISMGIMVSLIYLLLFIRWTNQDITIPVRELLGHMRNTRGGEVEQYALVRTNDEIGELAEGYNEMTHKLHEHMEHIFTMNRDLEKTVEERTQEVVMQKEEIEAQKEEIEAQLDLATLQRDTISNQKELILDSIRYAEKIQSALLPPARYLTESLSDHFILFKPRDIVSGDYYWTSFRDGKVLIAVADCTGHGVPGAFLSVLGISSMNEIVNREGSLKASKILESLRDFVIHTLHQTGSRGEAQDGIEIALCIIDPKKKSLEFAGANRPLYLVRSVSGKAGGSDPELVQLKGDRMPIGIYQQEADPFTNHTLKLQKNDTIYLFSDGYVDQLGGAKRKTYRSIHFRKLLLKIQDKTMAEQKEILLENHESWRGEVEQIDDILVVGIRM